MNSQDLPLSIGIDIAKKKFDVAGLWKGNYKHKTFSHNEQGFQAFVVWFKQQYGEKSQPLICMEATGAYSLPLAEYLVEHGYAVSVVNPAKIHAFGKSELNRAKTDKADAKLIARYAALMQPAHWTPMPKNIRQLHALVRRVEHVQEMIQMEKNRLETASPDIQVSINTVLSTLEDELKTLRTTIDQHIDNDPDLKQRQDLLESISGIGSITASYLLIALSPHRQFTNAKQAVAFAGLAPRVQQSGQWHRSTHLAKNGDTALRKALFMPALVAQRYNPAIKHFCNRLKKNGKNGKAVVCAAMRKLIHLAFAILKSGVPFDPLYAR